jgi:hypothetical protein
MGEMTRNGNLVRIHECGKLTLAISYETCIFTRLSTGIGVLNTTDYSKTTKAQINKHVMPDIRDEEYIEVDNIPRKASPETLIEAALKKNG